ncbi:IclR family transcriptional regulator [Paenibacillus naphthalenovorans]|uniref:IclR family transcriptional regulator n=1 Tax=Paenibacillus naphthalenovorans TaxID=162209 RepID=UPI0006CF32FB|nr:IclR family transcriptional regulator [Paenibacillus naphthalenovorans]GCL72493.1 IclR family transcriptional regulator [Paenibacillus naphthalenovorans]SDH99382.1 DNA-binding transcriptional regulator, IclR family [Paenibacillus naphthalenovorans]
MPIIQSVERALRILDLFDEYHKELKITEISSRMDLHKSTVHSLLKTLQEYHYIEQNPDNGKYRLGMKLLERSSRLVQSLDIRQAANPFLQKLSKTTGQTAHLVILDGKEGVYIDKVEGDKAVIRYSRIGRRIPLHCSAVGKALIAFKSPEQIRSILKGYEYQKHTEKTIRTEEAFLQELERVRKRGYATDDQENEPGVFCIAAAVRDHSGEVIAAISVSMLKARVTDEDKEEYVKLLLQTVEELSERMGYGVMLR